MFYILVGLWLAACGLAYLLKHLRRGTLTLSCPCVALMGLALSAILFLNHQPYLAAGVLALALYLTLTLLWSLGMQRRAQKRT